MDIERAEPETSHASPYFSPTKKKKIEQDRRKKKKKENSKSQLRDTKQLQGS